MFALAKRQVRGLAVEVGGLDLGARQVALKQVVLGQEVGVLQTQALLHAPAVGVGLHAHRGHALGVQGVPQGQAIVVFEVQLPALFAHIRDAEGQHRHTLDLEVAQGGEGEVFVRPSLRFVGDFLDGGAGVGAPHAQTAVGRGGVGDGHVGTAVLRHAADPHHVAVTGVGTVDHAVVVFGQAQHREVGAHTAFAVQEVGVNAFAHGGVTTDLGHADVLQQIGRIGALHVELGEVRDVDHADVFAHQQVLGVGDAPEVAVVPLVLAHRHAVAIHGQQVFVAGVTVRTLPTRELHEIGAQRFFAFVERALEDAALRGKGLAVVHRRVVDFERAFVAAVVDVLLVLLVGVGAGHIDAGVVDVRVTIGHPIGHQLAKTGRVFDPNGFGVPKATHLGGLTHGGVAVGGDLQQAVEGVFVVVAQLGQDGRELDGALQRLHDLLELQVALRGRQAGLVFFQQVARVAHARVFLFVVAPFDLAAFGRFWVPGVAQVSRVALVAQQRVADVFACAGKLQIRFEKRQGVVHRHDGQVFAGHGRDQAAPKTRTHHHVVGGDVALGGLHALDAAVLDAQAGAGRVRKRQQLARRHRGIDQFTGHHL